MQIKNPAKICADCSRAGLASHGPEGGRGEYRQRQSVILSTVTEASDEMVCYDAYTYCWAPESRGCKMLSLTRQNSNWQHRKRIEPAFINNPEPEQWKLVSTAIKISSIIFPVKQRKLAIYLRQAEITGYNNSRLNNLLAKFFLITISPPRSGCWRLPHLAGNSQECSVPRLTLAGHWQLFWWVTQIIIWAWHWNHWLHFLFSAASRADTQQIMSRLHRIEETRAVITQGTEITEAAMMCSLHIMVIFLLGYTTWVYVRRLGR